MKLRNRIYALVLVFSMGIASIANAAIVQHGSYFTDTTNGLDWLNNTPLAGQSYNSVLSGYGGYTTSGWRFAKEDELTQLLGTYVGPFDAVTYPWTTSIHSQSAFDSAYHLIEVLGINISFGLPPDPRATKSVNSTFLTGIATQGYYDDGGGSSNVGVFGLSAYLFSASPSDPLAQLQIFPDSNSPNDFHGPNVSAILVRASVAPVPEPETYAMMLAGLGLLGVVARRRKQKAVA